MIVARGCRGSFWKGAARLMLPPIGHLGFPLFPHRLGFATLLVCVANGHPRPWHLRSTVELDDTQLTESVSTFV